MGRSVTARTLSIRGAAEHNLQDVDIDLPLGSLIAVSGVSGSGKTSLAFDTVYAEARRRYLMTVERAGHGLVRRLKAPKLRQIEGLSPAVAISQIQAPPQPRSTVATLAGVYDYLRLLFARLGRAHCLTCGAPVLSQRFEEVYETAAGLPEGTKLLVLAPRRPGAGEDGPALLDWVDRAGYRRIRLDGQVMLLEETDPEGVSQRRLEVVVDRLAVKPDTVRRLKGSLEAALELGEGRVILAPAGGGDDMSFAVRPGCVACGAPFPPLTPALFSFSSSQGACPACHGLGTQSGLSPEQVFSRGQASIEEALGALWQEFGHQELRVRVDEFCAAAGVDPEASLGDWPPETAARLWTGERRRGGFIGVSRWLERVRAKAAGVELSWLEERLGDTACESCGGTRLVPETGAVEIAGATIGSVTALAVEAAAARCAEWSFDGPMAPVGETIGAHIQRSLTILQNLGLGYLELDRRADSLSSGELQRLRLGSALGSGMTQVLYVLDEPSVGLHARDVARLLQALQELRDAGNTVLVVEHDRALIEGADHVVDLGPGAGGRGGRIMAQGSPLEVADSGSLTGRYLNGELALGGGEERQPGPGGWLRIERLQGHNLKDISVAVPLGVLVCVTGVSGSGKSSLVTETLYPILAAHLQRGEGRPLPYGRCTGLEQLERVVAVDQRPIGRTPRSNAATYTGLMAHIRQLYAELPEARLRAYRPGHFSFNAPEGACPECGGRGTSMVRHGILEDLEVVCSTCAGGRYRREILDVRYREQSVADLLEFSVSQALEFFAPIPELARRLGILEDVGLGYLHLGQPASSLSGGEAQRVKLAAELSRPQRAHTLYLLDEPTTGLHLEDVRLLVNLLQRLVDQDNTVVVVEHHIELIATADYVIDLGPGGGHAGGHIVASGSPRDVARVDESWTGRFLRQHFAGGREPDGPAVS